MKVVGVYIYQYLLLSQCSIVQRNIIYHQSWRGNIFIYFYLISNNDGHGTVHVNAFGFKSKWPAKYLLQPLTHSISHQVARNCDFFFKHRGELKMQFVFSLNCKVRDKLAQLLQIWRCWGLIGGCFNQCTQSDFCILNEFVITALIWNCSKCIRIKWLKASKHVSNMHIGL